MIYIEDDPHHFDPDDELAPMAGTRVGHEIPDEDVIVIRVDHAMQSFRAARRSLIIVDIMDDSEDAVRAGQDVAAKLTGVRPLI